ncbi:MULTISPECIES: response regulator [Ramlibacter]|uniref:Response regulator n=1 Tax=Ramlibacter aquaticus TaxID=2780094 RepID=A0ABR9SLB0_9BURK|nr:MULTISPECIES: response regulator [Ramlibacter]MBE7942542.1 response regulator [Ramlibacter aquaticus]
MNAHADTSTRMPRILVIDDMPDNLFLMNGLLEDRYEVVQAASGQAGLKVVMSDAPPDMVLLDIMMPDMDGYEVLRRIRQHPPTAGIPVIFVSALASPQDQDLGRGLGAIDYVTKPVDPEQVILRIEAHVRATGRARRMERLSEKLARHLDPAAWSALFQGEAAQQVGFDTRILALVHAEGPGLVDLVPPELARLRSEVAELAQAYHGRLDEFRDDALLAWFEDPADALGMGEALQHAAAALRLRVAVHAGPCDLVRFERDGRPDGTVLGEAVDAVAREAQAAAPGALAVTAELRLLAGPFSLEAGTDSPHDPLGLPLVRF